MAPGRRSMAGSRRHARRHACLGRLGHRLQDGVYLIEGLAEGTYYLRFEDFTGAAIEWYDDVATMADATP